LRVGKYAGVFEVDLGVAGGGFAMNGVRVSVSVHIKGVLVHGISAFDLDAFGLQGARLGEGFIGVVGAADCAEDGCEFYRGGGEFDATGGGGFVGLDAGVSQGAGLAVGKKALDRARVSTAMKVSDGAAAVGAFRSERASVLLLSR
jgi:hypothetical protein